MTVTTAAGTTTLSIDHATEADSVVYAVRLWNGCGSSESPTSDLRVVCPCRPADVTAIGVDLHNRLGPDGQLTADDVILLVNIFGDGAGVTKARKGVKIMVLVDARGLPVAVTTGSASPHESKLVQGLFDFMLTLDAPERIIGDKAYDSDALDENLDDEGIQLISQHRKNHAQNNVTQDGRAAPLQTPLDRRTRDLVVAELPPAAHPLREVHPAVPRLAAPGLLHHPAQTGLRIGFS